MGFFDTIKKGAELAKKGADAMDETLKRKASTMNDSELRAVLEKHPDNRYVLEEASKRGIS